MDKRNWKDLGILFVAILLIAASISMALTRNISDESDDVVTFIQNSNGNYWTATGANFQLAIDDAGDYGWVELPYCNITLTDTIFANYSGLEIYGHGNASKLFLEADANVSMITIYNADNVYLHDFMLDGNGLNQPEWWRLGGNKYDYAHGIELVNVDDSVIEDMVIHDVASTAIQWSDGERVRISDCLLTNSSRLYVESGNGYDHWFGKGIHFDNCPFSIIESVIVDGACSTAIAVENEDQDDEDDWMQGVVVDNCRVRDSNVGFYVEWAKDCTFSDCYAEDCNRNDVYSDGCTGFLVASKTDRIYLDNCISIDNGKADSFSANFIINGQDTTLTDCHSYNSLYHGYVFSDDAINFNMDDCTSDNEAKIGIYSEAKTFSITDTNVNESGNQAMQLHNTQSITRGKVSDCSIRDASENAIQTAGGNLQITDNYIVDTTGRGVYVSTSSSLENIKIEGNIIDTPSNYGISITTSSGTIENGTIHDNTIIGGGYDSASMYLDDCLYFSIQDNTLITSSWESNYYPEYGIREVGLSDHNIIKNNVIRGQFGSPITVVGENTIASLNEGFDYDYYRDDLIWNSNGKYWAVDGTDDHVQIQAAIDDLTDRGSVSLPGGVLDVSVAITLDDNIKLYGRGINATILKQSDGASIGTGLLYALGKENVTISDLSIDGNKRGSSTGNCLYISTGSKDVWIDHINIHDGSGAGLRCSHASDIHITNCRIQVDTGGNQALSVNASNNIICSDLTLINPSLQGLDFANSNNCDLSDIIIKDSSHGMKIAGAYTGSDNITLTNFNIYNISDDAAVRLENCNHIKISNFDISNVEDGTSGNGFTIYSTANDVTISDSSIVNVGAKGISSPSTGASNITISNVCIDNSGTRGIDLYGENIILNGVTIYRTGGYNRLINCNGVIVSNCEFSYTTSFALYLDGVSNLAMSNCIFRENTLDDINNVYDFYGTPTAINNFTIIGCHFFGGGGDNIEIPATANYFIINNNIGDDDFDINAATTATRVCPSDTNIANIQTS